MMPGPAPESLNRTAFQATVHCLTGCGIGEILGLVLSTALGWHDLPSIVLAIVLAFVFGYGLTMRPLLAGGLPFRSAARTALAADTVSIVVMEIMDNAIVVAVPGAMAAGLTDGLFWGSLALSLVVAFIVAFPVNRWLIARGLGHAVVHARHQSGGGHAAAD
ncbi:MAG: hypothetical protein QOI00_1822 [Chloroflexota bacterium]|jgi:hypothetical protein|nr:hypothetical protein [Chloroflexota bacterium]MEA2607065.1 hypothetical protein [Chloroflexota bacterium]